jgi:hypothetical protein
MIAASATVITALVQLRLSWRKELRERERGQPITKKSRRGPVIAVLALMIAAAVAGFALSQYFVSLREADRDRDRQEMRADLQAKLSEINATALRLEQARTNERKQIETEVQRADASRLGQEGAAASAVVGPCNPGHARAGWPCTEQSALRIPVCASPAAATVRKCSSTYAPSGSPGRVARAAGQDAGKRVPWLLERPGDGGTSRCTGDSRTGATKIASRAHRGQVIREGAGPCGAVPVQPIASGTMPPRHQTL